MNWKDLKDVRDQLFGDDLAFQDQNLAHLRRIQDWLGIEGPSCFQLPKRARMASSLTARCECAFFGLSVPRFCVRLYLDLDHSSFFNLRRSALLVKNITATGGWGTRQTRLDRRIEEAIEYALHENMEPPSIIGDSVFAVPKRLDGEYRIVTTELHSAYGDARNSGNGAPCLVTPFVQHFWATGLCGHAAVFMAAALLQKHAVSIHALSEIAAMLRSSAKDEILITGLAPRHIDKYFCSKEVDLKAFDQHTPINFPWGEAADEPAIRALFDHTQCYRNALRAYVLSGMPVIKHVDLARLHGFPRWAFDGAEEAIYIRNTTNFPVTFRSEQRENHAVLIIGCSTKHPQDFVLHDPGGMPYLLATCSQLMNASTYATGEPSDPTSTVHTSYFQPVTPGRVTMPLHTSAVYTAGETKAAEGLYHIAMQIYRDLALDSRLFHACPTPREYLPGVFRLVQASSIHDTLAEPLWLSVAGPLSTQLSRAVSQIQDQLEAHDKDHWYWIQRFNHSCWMWDAEQRPPLTRDYELQDLGKYLVAVASEEGVPEISLPETRRASGEAASLSPPERNFEELQLSLITSFSARSTQHAVTNWPEGVATVELYAFMQDDVHELLSARPVGMTAVDAMATLADAPEVPDLAESIATLFEPTKARIRAFATFIPELFDRREDQRHKAKRALVFLAQLASAMRELGHDVTVIEVVGGSVIGSVLPVRFRGKRCILATRKTTGVTQVNLLDDLRDIAPKMESYRMKLAVEAEPGPLFALNTEDAIRGLVAQIRQMERSGELPPGVIGLNLDIGHWILSRIPVTILVDPDIMNYVFNVHISDHPNSHPGDCIVGRIHPPALFRSWTAGIRGLPVESYSGGVSVEFECAKDPRLLRDAVDSAAGVL